MKNYNVSLFLFVFVSLVCLSVPGIALAQERGMPPCCFVEPEAEPEVLPVIETEPFMDLAQERGMPPCCFVDPDTELV